jgi:hypothetical protein
MNESRAKSEHASLTDDDTAVISILGRMPSAKRFNIGKRVDLLWSGITTSHRDLNRDQCEIYLTILNVFATFGINTSDVHIGMKRLEKSFSDLVQRTKYLVLGDDLSAVFKNANDIYFADMVRDAEMRSDVVEGGFPWMKLYPGYLLRVMRRYLVRHDSTSISFARSLTTAKVGWPKLSENAVIRTTLKSAEAYGRRVVPFSELLGNKIANVARRVFGTFDMFGENKTYPLMKISPSTNASLLASRRNGGSYSLFDAFPEKVEDLVYVGDHVISLPRVPQSFAELNARYDDYRQEVFSAAFAAGEAVFDRRKEGQSSNLVKMMWIPEPNKFRGIGLGPGIHYTALQPLQGQLLSAWKRQSASTMLGDLSEKVQNIVTVGKSLGLDLLVSGDYEAATDKLSSWSGRVALEALNANSSAPSPLVSLGIDTLFNNTLYYPPLRWSESAIEKVVASALPYEVIEKGRYDVGGVFTLVKQKEIIISVKQINGQPMGHPLSFPLLCAINLACYEEAVDQYCMYYENDRPVSKKDKKKMLENVLVNGDDILFAGDDLLIFLWKDVVQKVGLVPSLGKNYVSKDFCMINSKCYIVRGDGKIKLCPYLNLRIIKGVSLKNGESAATPDMIGAELNSMFACEKMVGWLPAVFSRFKYPELSKVNWFLPCHLGGFGVDPQFANSETVVTEFQRKLAALYVCDASKMALFRMDREGVLEVLKPWKKRFARFAPLVVPESEVPELSTLELLGALPFSLIRSSAEAEGEAEEWVNRLLTIGKAVVGFNAGAALPPEIKALRQVTKTRLNGLSDEGFRKWWVVKEVPRILGRIRPLKALKLPTTREVKKRVRDAEFGVESYVRNDRVGMIDFYTTFRKYGYFPTLRFFPE